MYRFLSVVAGGREISVALVHCVSAFIDMVIYVGAFFCAVLLQGRVLVLSQILKPVRLECLFYDVIFYRHIHKYSSCLYERLFFLQL